MSSIAANTSSILAQDYNVSFRQSFQRRPKTSRSTHPKLWRMLPPVKVTNEGKEVRVKHLYQEKGVDDDSEYIIVDPQNPVPNPELGPLERRVSVTFEEGLALDTVDTDAMNYWFTEPSQGWQTEKRKLLKANGVPVDDIYEDFRHDSSERKPLSDLQLGDILVGRVVEQLMHHGLRVDVGAGADGLIPLKGIKYWKRLEDSGFLPTVGDTIEVEVYAIREDPVFRFPLQVAPVDEKLSSILPPPEEHKPPLDLRDVPLNRYEEVARLSGRDWGTQKVLVAPADIEDVMTGTEEMEISEEDIALFDSIVSELDL